MSKLPLTAICLAAGLMKSAALADPRQHLNACAPDAEALSTLQFDGTAGDTVRGMCEWAAYAPADAPALRQREPTSHDLLGELDAARRAAMPVHPWQSEDLAAAILSIEIRDLLADIESRRIDIWPIDKRRIDDRTVEIDSDLASEG